MAAHRRRRAGRSKDPYNSPQSTAPMKIVWRDKDINAIPTFVEQLPNSRGFAVWRLMGEYDTWEEADASMNQMDPGHPGLEKKGSKWWPFGNPEARETREVNDRKTSMTFGVLPSFKDFKHDVSTRIDPEKPNDTPYWPKGMIYPMELVDSREIELAQEFGKLDEFDTSRPGYAFGFQGNEKQIYDFLKFLVRKFNKDGDVDEGSAGGLASSIMYTLGYEWI